MTTEDKKQLLLIVGKNFQRQLILRLYNVEEDEWYPEKCITKEKLPERIEDGFFCNIGSKIYFMISSGEENKTKSLCSFDLITSEITRSEWTYEIDVWKVTVIGHFIYFYDVNRDLWCIDASTKIARICTQMKDRHCPYGIQSVNGIVYVLGTTEVGPIVDTSECYDPVKGEVKYVSPLRVTFNKSKERYIRTAELGRKLYVVKSDSLANIFVFTPEKNTWQTIDVKNNPPFNNGVLTSANNLLIGFDFRCVIHVYNSESNKWDSRKSYKGSMIDSKAAFAIDKSALNYE